MPTGQVRGANPHVGWIVRRGKGSTFFLNSIRSN